MARKRAYKTLVSAEGERAGLAALGEFARSRRYLSAIASDAHPISQRVAQELAGMSAKSIAATCKGALNGDLVGEFSRELLGGHLKLSVGRKLYESSPDLSGLSPAILADRRSIEPSTPRHLKLTSVPRIHLELLSMLDRRLSEDVRRDGVTGDFAHGAFNLERRVDGALVGNIQNTRPISISQLAHDLDWLRNADPGVFRNALAGDFLTAFEIASRSGQCDGPNKRRDRIIRTVAAYFLVCACEHGQRAHAFIRSYKRNRVPSELRGDVDVEAEIRVGAIAGIERQFREASKTLLAKFDPGKPFDQVLAVAGDGGHIGRLATKLVEREFGNRSDAQLKQIHTVIGGLAPALRANLKSPSSAINAALELFTARYAVSQRTFLLAVDMRLCGAAAIAQSIIDEPALAAGTGLFDLLYPEPPPFAQRDYFANAASRLCVIMERHAAGLGILAEYDPSDAADASNDDSSPNCGHGKRAAREARGFLHGISVSRAQGKVPQTPGEQLFANFDPLIPPVWG